MPWAHFAFLGPKVTTTVLILETEGVEKFDISLAVGYRNLQKYLVMRY